MAKVPFETDLKKDFRNLQELITVKGEAYDNYCAIKLAQKSVLKHELGHLELEKVMRSLEHFREYTFSVLLLDFVGVNLVPLNKAEEEIYMSALNERLAKLEKKAADPKQDKLVLDKLNHEIEMIRTMLVDVQLACRKG